MLHAAAFVAETIWGVLVEPALRVPPPAEFESNTKQESRSLGVYSSGRGTLGFADSKRHVNAV